jgi:hypothetical protein
LSLPLSVLVLLCLVMMMLLSLLVMMFFSLLVSVVLCAMRISILVFQLVAVLANVGDEACRLPIVWDVLADFLAVKVQLLDGVAVLHVGNHVVVLQGCKTQDGNYLLGRCRSLVGRTDATSCCCLQTDGTGYPQGCI